MLFFFFVVCSDVRAETTPRAGWTLMYFFTAVIYIAAIVAFVLLYQLEAAKSTTETVILPYDNTGNDHFTCQMISRVTASYQVPTVNEPGLGYHLVNIMESKSECQTDLAVSDPCGSPMVYYPGSETALWSSGATFGAAAMYGNHTVFVYDTTTPIPSIQQYDYTTGTYVDVPAYLDDTVVTTSMAVDRDGYIIYLSSSSGSPPLYMSRTPNTGNWLMYNTQSAQVRVLNDNLYNVYAIVNNHNFTAVDVYSDPTVSSVLFSTPDGDDILHAAVYHDGTSPTVYFYTYNYDTFYQYKDDVITSYEVLSRWFPVVGMFASAQYVYFVTSATSENGKALQLCSQK